MRFLCVVAPVAALAACTGQLQQPGGAGAQAGQGPIGGTAGSGGIQPAGADCSVGPRAPLRRLTRFEYNNTAFDLLGDATSPANAFPGEQLGNGFGNDADAQPVSTLLAEQHSAVAEAIAARATAPDVIAKLASCASGITATSDAVAEGACVRTIVETFAARAYRRPLVPSEVEELVALYGSIRPGATFAVGVAGVIEAVLQMPEFQYRVELGLPEPGRAHLMRPTSYEMAARLSYFLWGTMPDEGLRSMAAAGRLTSKEDVLSVATTMLDDARSRPMIRFFFDRLLPISGLSSLERDASIYPSFTQAIGALMREETQTFLEHQIFSGPGTWPSVFNADYTFLNGPLAAFYGMPGITGDAFQRVSLDTTRRLGLLTQGGMVAGPVHSNHTNPVVRGNFILKKLMCRVIPLPTGEILAQIKPPDPYTGKTGRERFSLHSQQPVCAACHQQIDPIGFALENFDAVGLWRDQENGVAIDASGEVSFLNGPFSGPVGLAQKLAESPDVQSCFAQNWLSFAYGRVVDAKDQCSIDSVQTAFQSSGYSVKALLLSLTQADGFLYLPAVRE